MDTSGGPKLYLQVNNSGAWKTVVTFPLHVRYLDRVKRHAEALGRVDSTITWRIATAEALPKVQWYWTAKEGWRTA